MAGFLIAGNGLAAHLLAHQLSELQVPVTVAGAFLPGAASPAAYGIMNPVHLRTAVPAWKVDQLLDFAMETYGKIQSHYKSENWFYPIHIRHFFSGADEARMFRMNYESGNLFEWLEFAPDNESVFIRNAAFVDTPLMLKAVRAILPEVNWIDTVWNYEEFLPENGNWSFRGQQFSHLIFSEGFRVTGNPWFCMLPFAPNKGQGLHVSGPVSEAPCCLHRKKLFFTNTGGNQWKVGSTFDPEFSGEEPQEVITADLLEACSFIDEAAPELLQVWTGIRPASGDRRPIIGTHPFIENLHIFNGFGSRGLSAAPRLAAEMAGWLVEGKPLWPEVNVQRFLKRFKNAAASA